MARPKKDNIDGQATVKIERAFWSLLETTRYSEITVLRISQEAGINRNSFYYHYRDIEDLAYQAFRNNADPEITSELMTPLLALKDVRVVGDPREAGASFDPMVIPHAKKIMLCARSDSPFLNQMVHELLKEIWLKELGIREDSLSSAEKLQIRFIFAGLVAALGSPEVEESPQIMSMLSQTGIGKAAIETLKEIAQG